MSGSTVSKRRIALAAALIGLLFAGAGTAQPLRLPSDPCDEVKPFVPFEFEGQRFSVASGIDVPELQRIDAVISTRGCLGRAQQLLDAYRAAHPDDYRAEFMQGRIDWIEGDDVGAEARLHALLQAHPDFAAVKTLLGGLALDRSDTTTAMRWLAEVRAESPGDVWGYVNHLVAQFKASPSAATAERMLTIAAHTGFPPNARGRLLNAILESPRAETAPLYERAARAALTFESVESHATKTLTLARVLISWTGKPQEGRELLLPLLDDPSRRDPVRVLIAESHLREALAQSRDRSDRNAASIEQALAAVDGDTAALGEHLKMLGALELVRLLPGYGSVDALDADGNTELCRAVLAYDEPLIKDLLLQQKADPNVACNGLAPLALLALQPFKKAMYFGSESADLLRQAGADPDPVVVLQTGQRLVDYCLEDYERSEQLGCRPLREDAMQRADAASQR